MSYRNYFFQRVVMDVVDWVFQSVRIAGGNGFLIITKPTWKS